ncbi:acetylglutamate kinase, partial [bacterium]
MARPETMEAVLRNLLLLQHVGIRVVLVHGGGPEIDGWLARLGIERRFENGQRVTDDATMDVVEMALAGRANKALVAEISRCGGRAVGLSGRDAAILTA